MAKINSIDLAKWIGIVLTVVALFGSSFVWAANHFGDSQRELKAEIKENYTKREDFARIEERIIAQERQIDDVHKKLDSILRRLQK